MIQNNILSTVETSSILLLAYLSRSDKMAKLNANE